MTEVRLQINTLFRRPWGKPRRLLARSRVPVRFSMQGRCLRQGQQAGAVVVQHIVTAGTIDERILEAISHKEKGQNALIEAVKAEL